MGNYIYALRSPRLTKAIVIDNGTDTPLTGVAAVMSYLYKPSYSHRDRDNWVNGFFTRMENLWNGIQRPHYAVFPTNDKKGICVGDNVYEFPGQECVPWSYNDGTISPMKKVGVVTKVSVFWSLIK